MPSPLFVRIPLAFQAVYSDLKQRALEQTLLLLGTPGTVSERTQDGRKYFYRQYYDSEGAKAAEHIGPVDDAAAARSADEVRDLVVGAKALITDAQTLAKAGYNRIDARTEAVLVSLSNASFFRAGGLLVGSHALAAMLNDLGARVVGIRTEDLDVVRQGKLTLPAGTPSFEELLHRSRVPLNPVPTFDRKAPSTSYTVPPRLQRGTRFRVDLLTSIGGGEPYRPVAVPELSAHALGLPHFRYLVEESVPTIVVGKSAMIPVNIPRPERLAWHKILVSQLRDETSDKREKDRRQAATLIAALTEDAPESLLSAFDALSGGSKTKLRPALEAVIELLEERGHDNAAALVRDVG